MYAVRIARIAQHFVVDGQCHAHRAAGITRRRLNPQSAKRPFTQQALAGAYLESGSVPCFRRVKAPTPAGLEHLVHRLSERICRHLERRGLLVRDIENGTLARDENDDSTLDELRGHSIT